MAPKPKKQKPPNPISAAIRDWVDQSGLDVGAIAFENGVEILVAEAPKRWVDYEPMILLPSGSFTTAAWTAVLGTVTEDCRLDLWKRILRGIGTKTSGKATHLAVNDGIPLMVAAQSVSSAPSKPDEDSENILRSPIGLRTLYGDFGPTETQGHTITQQDFDHAFWVSTKQNGIYQTWAPRWTMFSRGNVKEKARLLAFHDAVAAAAAAAAAVPAVPAGTEPMSAKREESSTPPLAHRARSRTALADTWAIDLYAGIGYFVFSYAKLGMRVLCWELNPWSVEGLRRGAAVNGWSVRVVQGEEELARPAHELVAGEERIVVFLQDNREAARRVQELRACGFPLPVSHVNCGLLPRSDDSWDVARTILLGGGEDRDGWLHLHENVGVDDISGRRDEIQGVFDRWDLRDECDRTAKVEHVELVKTFAPSVWHCVFDVYITKSRLRNAS